MRGRREIAWLAAAMAATALCAAQSAAASTVRQRTVALAARQIGYAASPGECTKFGPCESWCSLFVTWVWRREGIPIPSLAFTGYMYDWSKANTYALSPRRSPEPGDAVLFGTGPQTVETSRHTGIVEAVYPGYIVTIEGNSLSAVRRYVVPIRDPQRVGEPGPIYGYASPLPAGAAEAGSARAASAPAPSQSLRFARLSRAVIDRQQAHTASTEMTRLLRAIASFRAFQHMPYRAAHIRINWMGVNRRGLIDVRITSDQSLPSAERSWRAFLRRFRDAGHAYVVSFRAPPLPEPVTGVPVSTAPPSILGTPALGQTLTAVKGSWSNTPTSYSYQWEDCDALGESCSPISGATGQTDTVGPGDVGDTLRVIETATNPLGPSQHASSAPTGVVGS